MARKMMTKEVTKTTVTVARIQNENGELKTVVLPPIEVVGNVSVESAQRLLKKNYDFPVTVTGVQAETTTYEMPVEEFIKVATIKPPKESEAKE